MRQGHGCTPHALDRRSKFIIGKKPLSPKSVGKATQEHCCVNSLYQRVPVER